MKSKDQISLENAYARTYGIRKVKGSELEQMIEDVNEFFLKFGEMDAGQLIHFREHLQKAIGAIDERLISSKQVKDIADQHGVSIEQIEAQLSKGLKKERTEHRMDPATARKTALDHLSEDPNYYDKLEQIEEK